MGSLHRVGGGGEGNDLVGVLLQQEALGHAASGGRAERGGVLVPPSRVAARDLGLVEHPRRAEQDADPGSPVRRDPGQRRDRDVDPARPDAAPRDPRAAGCSAASSAPSKRPPPPSTPRRCADTPTQAQPDRVTCRWVSIQCAGASNPALTLSHSRITVPVKAAGSDGRHTTRRVANGARPDGVTSQYPSAPAGPADW
jgi:hypothetical protein